MSTYIKQLITAFTSAESETSVFPLFNGSADDQWREEITQGTAFLLFSVIYQIPICVNGCACQSEPAHMNYFYNDGHTNVWLFVFFHWASHNS